MKTMRVRIKIFGILLTVLVLSACEDSDIHGPGVLQTDVRFLSGFHSVSISDNIETNFYFHHQQTGVVEITGGSKLLPKIATEVKDSVLILKDNNTWQWLRNNESGKIVVNIYTDSIASIRYDGYANIRFQDTLKIKKFKFESVSGMGKISLLLKNDSTKILTHTGAPDVEVTGSSDYFYLFTHSHGTVQAFEFQADNVFVHSKSTANCFISPSQTLGATIEYLGNVYFRNNPTILWLDEKHQGRLIQVE